MEKLKKTANPMDLVLAKVRDLCPAAVQGDKIDFERLRLELEPSLSEENETYNFTWVGKRDAILGATLPVGKTLRPDVETSKNWDETKNLYIEGDNLDVLKLLQESYLGKVKMIYIDPPYNTGNDFVYCDNFAEKCKEYMDKKGQCDIETNERLFKNDESNGRYHSNWCTMIYPRLKVARDLLSDDGVIFISIDDNEQANLKKICDEVFGEENFVAKFDWRKKTGANDAKTIAVVTESILLYAKNNSFSIENNIWMRDEGSVDKTRYKYEDEFVNERGRFYYDTLDRGGLQYSDSMNFGIEAPDGGMIWPNGRDCFINDGWIWKWGKEKVEWGLKNKFLEFSKSNKSKGSAYTIKYKVYEKVDNEGNVRDNSGRAYSNLILEPINQQGNSEMKAIFGQKTPFSNPKPVGLIRYFLNAIDSRNSIILDFFSGSATTAHAVMQLNAEDGGNRRFIMVQLPEKCDDKSEAAKAGYENICEIGKERIRRAGDKIMAEHPDAKLDIGFKVFKLDEPNMKTGIFNEPSAQTQAGLFENVENIVDGRTSLDLLYDSMIKLGLTLDLDVKTVQSGDTEYFNVDNNSLIACFADQIPESIVHEIAAMHPLRVVFRDSSFANDAAKINVTEIFKTISPNTKITVL